MKQYTVRFEPVGKTFLVPEGTPLHDVMNEYGIEFLCGGTGKCGKCKVKLLQGTIELSDLHRQLLRHHGLDESWRLACMSRITADVVLEVHQYETFVLADHSSFAITPREGHGIAIDVGTTTLVAQMIDLSTGHVVAVQTALNPQASCGADIMSRISWAMRPGGLSHLSSLIRQQLGNMIAGLQKEKPGTKLIRIVMVGNTVMHHLFCGLDVTPLSAYPFHTPFLEARYFSPGELAWPLPDEVSICFMPAIGSFVGSDILAGIMASGMYKSPSFQVLIDLGTNGELVMGNRERLLCASTAAGPAFEGTNISMGMRAATGAIASVSARGDEVSCHVIGNVPARGICGSGLIDAVSVFLDKGHIDGSGEITGGSSHLTVHRKVSLSQKDIREFQLAKAAIAAGIQILMQQLHITAGDIEKIYIAGAFGSYINTANVIRTGMLPFPEEKIHKLGNSALMGAKMFLFDDVTWKSILPLCRHVSLESDPSFQDTFVNNMFFT